LYSLHEGYLCLLVFYRTTTYNNSFSAPMDIFQSWHSLGNFITVFPLQKHVVNKWLIFTQSNFGKVIFLHSCIIHYTCACFLPISSTKKVTKGQNLPSNKKFTVWPCMLLLINKGIYGWMKQYGIFEKGHKQVNQTRPPLKTSPTHRVGLLASIDHPDMTEYNVNAPWLIVDHLTRLSLVSFWFSIAW